MSGSNPITVENVPGNFAGNNLGLMFPCARQPDVICNFGGEAAIANIGTNLRPGGTNLTPFGTPTITPNYDTFVGASGSGLMSAFGPTGPFTVLAVVEQPGWVSAGGVGGYSQIVGNLSSNPDVIDVSLQSHLVGSYLPGGTGTTQLSVTPTTWKMIVAMINPGVEIFLWDVTDGTFSNFVPTAVEGATTKLLQFFSYGANTTFGGAINAAFLAFWSGYSVAGCGASLPILTGPNASDIGKSANMVRNLMLLKPTPIIC